MFPIRIEYCMKYFFCENFICQIKQNVALSSRFKIKHAWGSRRKAASPRIFTFLASMIRYQFTDSRTKSADSLNQVLRSTCCTCECNFGSYRSSALITGLILDFSLLSTPISFITIDPFSYCVIQICTGASVLCNN